MLSLSLSRIGCVANEKQNRCKKQSKPTAPAASQTSRTPIGHGSPASAKNASTRSATPATAEARTRPRSASTGS